MNSAAAIQTTFDVAAFRSRFPILSRAVKGKPLVYFDNAATTQKPEVVIKALTDYYSGYNANIHRGLHSLAEEATAAYERVRDTVSKYIGAANREEIIFTSGTTAGINLVAHSWGMFNLKEGDEVLVSGLEHHSNIVPWQMVCERTGAKLKVIKVTEEGELDMSSFHAQLSSKTKMVAVNHASNALGTINPVKEIIAAAHKFGSLVLIDGAQTLAHLEIDVVDMDADFFACSSHKAYGPTGTGVLYGKKNLLEEMEPWQGGGEMIREVSFEGTTYNDLPYKFEAGTPNIADVIGFGAALDFIGEYGLAALHQHESMLLEEATSIVSSLSGVRIVGTAKHKVSVLSFVVEGVHPQDVGILLDTYGIAVRTGNHCAQPLMDRYCIPGTTRASFAAYNTLDEIHQLGEGLQRAIKMLR